MNTFSKVLRCIACMVLFVSISWLPATSFARDGFNNASLHGIYVFSFDGAFSSAPPPFSGDVLEFQTAQVGRLEFDGAGLLQGETMLAFHHPTIPFGIRSRKALLGAYTVDPTGRTVLESHEYSLGTNGEPVGIRTNSAIYECQIVHRQQLAKCVMHSLISYQQGPNPRELPVTMSGSLQRQH